MSLSRHEMEEMLAVNHLEGGPLLAHCSRNKDNRVLIEHAIEGNAGFRLPYKGTIFTRYDMKLDNLKLVYLNKGCDSGSAHQENREQVALQRCQDN